MAQQTARLAVMMRFGGRQALYGFGKSAEERPVQVLPVLLWHTDEGANAVQSGAVVGE